MTELTDSLKSILLKVAIELKRLGWKPNSKTNEIDIHQGYIDMYKEYDWSQDQLPPVSVTMNVNLTLAPNPEQHSTYYIIYKNETSLWIDHIGGNDSNSDSDVDVVFSEQDSRNQEKIVQAAKLINSQVRQTSDYEAEQFAENNAETFGYAEKDQF